MDEHRHPPVRLFDRAARPIITPHARLPYSMPRVVLYHAESEACPRPLGTIAVDLVSTRGPGLHYPRHTQQLHRTGTTNMSTRMWVPVCITVKFPWLTTDIQVHALFVPGGAPQAVNNMHCGAVQVAAPQFRGDPEQRRSSGGGVASIRLAQTPSLLLRHQLLCHTRAACQCE